MAPRLRPADDGASASVAIKARVLPRSSCAACLDDAPGVPTDAATVLLNVWSFPELAARWADDAMLGSVDLAGPAPMADAAAPRHARRFVALLRHSASAPAGHVVVDPACVAFVPRTARRSKL